MKTDTRLVRCRKHESCKECCRVKRLHVHEEACDIPHPCGQKCKPAVYTGKELIVTVAGVPCSGKSTVARVLELALVDAGVEVERVDDNGTGYGIDEPSGLIEATADRRLTRLVKSGLRVVIRTEYRKRIG